jgi:small subunit ribosomal protein S20
MNAPLRSRAKSAVTKARRTMDSDEADGAEAAVRAAVVALDKAAQKGAIHRKNADRRKSRIMKHLQRTTVDE